MKDEKLRPIAESLPVSQSKQTLSQTSPPDASTYLEPRCKKCNDLRWLSYEASDIYDPKFGQVYQCTECPSFGDDEDSKVDIRFKASGLPDYPMNIRNFIPSKQPNLKAENEARKAKNAALHWVKDGPLLVIVTGPTGCGKSHLAQGSALELLEQGKTAWYLSGAEFSQQVRSSEVNNFKNRVMTIPYLVLDEAYVTYDPSGYVQASVSEIMSHRYDQQLPSLMLGNILHEQGKTPEEKLSKILGQRLTSRVLGHDNGLLVSMWQCKDIRRNNEH